MRLLIDNEIMQNEKSHNHTESERSIVIEALLQTREKLFEAIGLNISLAQRVQKELYDKKHNPHELQDGTTVLKDNTRQKQHKGGKMDDRWCGPYAINRCIGRGESNEDMDAKSEKNEVTDARSDENEGADAKSEENGGKGGSNKDNGMESASNEDNGKESSSYEENEGSDAKSEEKVWKSGSDEENVWESGSDEENGMEGASNEKNISCIMPEL